MDWFMTILSFIVLDHSTLGSN